VQAALKFVDWAFKNGDQMALDLDYVPLPATVKDQVRAAWKGVTDPAGKPIF
jgi:phosphate transport system substrate-binding protein